VTTSYRSPCALPDLPGPITPVVGWATPDQIMMSKADAIEIVNYVRALRDWIEVAAVCLEAQ
jgi:hypothetical protein